MMKKASRTDRKRSQKNTESLDGEYTDGSRIIAFKDLADIRAIEKHLKAAVKEWLSLLEK